MKLIITIDTEEDNWGSYSPHGHTLENIGKIPVLQDLFDEFEIRPTYLITYPVATDKDSIAILKEIHKKGKCEIGTHLHPWNTPPYEEETGEYNSMLCNLPEDLQLRKIRCLHDTIERNFGITPVSFRAGRWGYDDSVARNLSILGYKVDSSITPYINWKANHGPDFTNVSPIPFRYAAIDKSWNGQLVEVPATIGYLQRNFVLSNILFRMVTQKPLKYLRIAGILNKLGIINRVWLSPELSNSKVMIKLAKIIMIKNYSFINMVLHSSALKAGLIPFMKTGEKEKQFMDSIRDFLVFSRDAGIKSITLSESFDEVF